MSKRLKQALDLKKNAIIYFAKTKNISLLNIYKHNIWIVNTNFIFPLFML